MLKAELERGAAIALALDADTYRDARGHPGSIGSHIRHDLEMVECFLNGLAGFVIDYSSRRRDAAVENDPSAAAAKTRSLVKRLGLVSELGSKTVFVRSETDPDAFHRSTVGRELEYLYSHTVHHHALIGERLKAFGIDADPDLGVALSTIRYRKRRAAPVGG